CRDHQRICAARISCQRFVCCRASEPAGDEPPAPSRTRAQEPFLLSGLREASARPLAPASRSDFASRARYKCQVRALPPTPRAPHISARRMAFMAFAKGVGTPLNFVV